MKTADLYIRVSTDEQANKGYSQRSQEEVLLKYCEINKIQVRKINDLRTNNMNVSEVEQTLDHAIKNLTAINKLYCESDHYGKRKIIGSIYPEKFTFDELRVRTVKPEEVFKFIYLINSKLHTNKNGTNGNFLRLSQKVIH